LGKGERGGGELEREGLPMGMGMGIYEVDDFSE
jgi:hypothetical protein